MQVLNVHLKVPVIKNKEHLFTDLSCFLIFLTLKFFNVYMSTFIYHTNGLTNKERIWNPTILNQKHLKSGIFQGQISNGQALAMSIAMVPIIRKNCTIWNADFSIRISNGFSQNGSQLSRFQMVGLPDFRSHSNPDHSQK